MWSWVLRVLRVEYRVVESDILCTFTDYRGIGFIIQEMYTYMYTVAGTVKAQSKDLLEVTLTDSPFFYCIH